MRVRFFLLGSHTSCEGGRLIGLPLELCYLMLLIQGKLQ